MSETDFSSKHHPSIIHLPIQYRSLEQTSTYIFTSMRLSNIKQTVHLENILLLGFGFFVLAAMRASLVSAGSPHNIHGRRVSLRKQKHSKFFVQYKWLERGRNHLNLIANTKIQNSKYKIETDRTNEEEGNDVNLINLSLTENSFRKTFSIHPSLSQSSSSS